MHVEESSQIFQAMTPTPTHCTSYLTLLSDATLILSFKEIYRHMILRLTEEGERIENHRRLEKVVQHFEAGDLSQIMTVQVSISVINIFIIILHIGLPFFF